MDPGSGSGSRKGKSRLACIPCRTNKQRCDGATRHPCRRCEIYKLVCDYEGGQPPPTAIPVASTSNSVPGSSRADSLVMAEMARSIREMSERLRQIELGLSTGRHLNVATSSSGEQSTPHSSSLPPDPPQMPASPSEVLDDDSHPMQIVAREVEQIEEPSLDRYSPAWARLAASMGPPPDATLRGLVNLSQAEAAFAFFHKRIQPWIDCISCPNDPFPLIVQARSPFLYHVILLVVHYYDTSAADRAIEVYHGLNVIVKELLSEAILSPTSLTLNPDFCAGLILLLYYKPLQHASFFSRGIYDSGKISQASKINPKSSLMLHALMHRTAFFLGLPNAPSAFLQATASSATTIPDEVFSNLRLWYWLCTGDIHGSLLYGRSPVTDAGPALRTTRLLAQISTHPGDARRASILEIYAFVRTPIDSPQPSKLRLAEIPRISEDLDRWETYWDPILTAAQLSNDNLAYTAYNTAYSVTMAVMSAVFSRWSAEKKALLATGKAGRPTLSPMDWDSLRRATTASQRMIFSVSVEATGSGTNPLRTEKWSANERPGKVKPLELDVNVFGDFVVALDPILCVTFIYAMLLLVRMASAGLIDTELELRRHEYEAGAPLDAPQALGTASKLTRLLELGAAFLEATAPQPDHPAKKHARLVRHILATGLGASISPSSASTLGLDSASAWPSTAAPPEPSRIDPWLWDIDAPMPTFGETFDPSQLFSFTQAGTQV